MMWVQKPNFSFSYFFERIRLAFNFSSYSDYFTEFSPNLLLPGLSYSLGFSQPHQTKDSTLFYLNYTDHHQMSDHFTYSFGKPGVSWYLQPLYLPNLIIQTFYHPISFHWSLYQTFNYSEIKLKITDSILFSCLCRQILALLIKTIQV